MKKIERKNKGIPKINVIPILDAVFIFIFFLLMSAQFLEIYEIGSDAPTVKTISSEDDKKPPLNLTLKILPTKVIVSTGIPSKTIKEISLINGEYDYKKLNQTLINIKKNHGSETSVIFKPDEKVPYKKIVQLMDSCREFKVEGNKLTVKNKKGEMIQTDKLFDQIIFETIM